MEAAAKSVNDSLYNAMRAVEDIRQSGDFSDKPLSPGTLHAMQDIVAVDTILDLMED